MNGSGSSANAAIEFDPQADAVLLVAHGTVDDLDDLPTFLTTIRRGHAPPPELVSEVRRRYEAIGGRSPLNAINEEVAQKLERVLGVRVAFANRLFRPYPADVLTPLAKSGVRRIFVVPLAQHSAHVYADAVRQAVNEAHLALDVIAARNWGRTRALTDAFARAIVEALEAIAPDRRESTTVVMTAHSLPSSVVEAGDPYEREVRASAVAVAQRVRVLASTSLDCVVAFQSQGLSSGPGGRSMSWLGPDLRTTLEELRAGGKTHVVIAPIGFLADHVEILYDIDIEAQGWANELGLSLSRTRSLNASDALIETLAIVARRLLREGP